MSTYIVIVPEGSEVVWAENRAIDRAMMITKEALDDLLTPQSFPVVVKSTLWDIPLVPARKVDLKDITCD